MKNQNLSKRGWMITVDMCVRELKIKKQFQITNKINKKIYKLIINKGNFEWINTLHKLNVIKN